MTPGITHIITRPSLVPVMKGADESLYEVEATNTNFKPGKYRASICNGQAISVMVERNGTFAFLNEGVHHHTYDRIAAYIIANT